MVLSSYRISLAIVLRYFLFPNFSQPIEDMIKLAEIRHLEVAFKAQRHFITAIDEVNFSLHPGEAMVLLVSLDAVNL